MTDEGMADQVAIGDPASAQLLLGGAVSRVETSGRFPVRLAGPGIQTSSFLDLEDWNGGVDRLPAYFEDLASSWRGWDGAKTFDDDGATVHLSATHDGVGLVVLNVTTADHSYRHPGGWRVTMEVPIEPGALGRIATEVRSLFSRDISRR